MSNKKTRARAILIVGAGPGIGKAVAEASYSPAAILKASTHSF